MIYIIVIIFINWCSYSVIQAACEWCSACDICMTGFLLTIVMRDAAM